MSPPSNVSQSQSLPPGKKAWKNGESWKNGGEMGKNGGKWGKMAKNGGEWWEKGGKMEKGGGGLGAGIAVAQHAGQGCRAQGSMMVTTYTMS